MISFVVVSKEAWGDTRWARKQWLPYYLAQCEDVGKVLYLDRHSAWWRGEESHEPQQFGKVKVVQEGLCLPLERFSWARQQNRTRIATALLQQLDAETTWVSLLYHPYDFAMIKLLKRRSKVVFDWTEDWATFHQDESMAKLQQKCVEEADIVLTVTQALYARAVSWRGSAQGVYHVPNATVFEPTSLAKEPDLLASIKQPRIGFVGHVGPWFDGELVASLMQEKPEWQWVMMGGVDGSVNEMLQGYKNYHKLGVFKPEELMPLMQHCDVLVAPYVQGIQGDATKLYDYLAARKPVVSTRCETAENLQPWVVMCKNKTDWLGAISSALTASSAALHVPSDKEIMRHHWSAKAEQVLQIVQGKHE